MKNDANNFDAVRLFLALIVVFSHVGALTKQTAFNWFVLVFDSGFAVKGFFVISGYLVMNSYISSKSIPIFIEKRVRRIYPGYLFAIGLCLIIGLCLTTIPVKEFLKSSYTLKYLIANGIFLNFLQLSLPGVFTNNPLDNVMNGSLWSIKVEICLYFLIPLFYFLYKKYSSIMVTILIVTVSILWNIYFFKYSVSSYFSDKMSHQFPAYLSFFVIGSYFAFNKHRLQNLRVMLIISGILFFALQFLSPISNYFLQPIFYSILILWLSTSACNNINAGRYGDFSYGIYLLHFPIIQTYVYIGLYDWSPWGALTITIISTLMLAFVSWILIEKPMLKRSSHYIKVAV
jgi:peptidoglycan/LPS O-acetylase OafA/YrhL